jgi:hypothetical protein
VNKKVAVNPRTLAAARTRMIFGLRSAPHLTHAQYQDYLSWVHIMVDVERQRVAQRTAQPPLLAVMDPEEEAAASQAPASEAAA